MPWVYCRIDQETKPRALWDGGIERERYLADSQYCFFDEVRMAMQVTISTVTPVYSGQNYLENLAESLHKIRQRWEDSNAPIKLHESIFVDDGSIDASNQVLKFLTEKYSWIRVIQLSRNFGQHPATIAGILYTSGDWVVTLDEDMQHPPELIESMLHTAVIQNADVVYVHSPRRVHGNLVRNLGSRLIKKIIGFILNNKKIEFISSFRLIRGQIARATSSVCSHDTYFDIALTWFTNSIDYISQELCDSRHVSTGTSGYNLYKLFSHARRMLFSTNMKLFRAGGVLGLFMFFFSITGSFFLIFQHYFLNAIVEVKGWASLMLAIMFIGGVSLLLLGIILEYVSVVLLHTQGKPVFFVANRSMDKILLDYFKRNMHASTR